jgi:hypothetical protein
VADKVGLLRYTALPSALVANQSVRRIVVNASTTAAARTQHLLFGCACSSRQTKLLAHDPSAIFDGPPFRRPIGLLVAERLPEIDMRPCQHPLCNGLAKPVTWVSADRAASEYAFIAG